MMYVNRQDNNKEERSQAILRFYKIWSMVNVWLIAIKYGLNKQGFKTTFQIVLKLS